VTFTVFDVAKSSVMPKYLWTLPRATFIMLLPLF
jgi:hypothetical protein